MDKQGLYLSMLLYLFLYIVAWPLYRYVFDVDGVGYCVVAEHIASGNWSRAVNGFWSPLHSWLVAPLLKCGLVTRDAFFVTNALISMLVLLLLNSLQLHLKMSKQLQMPMLFCAVILLLHFTYFQLAADILLLPFLLGYLLLLLRDDFFSNRNIQVYCALLVSLAYFAKTYALPFLMIIHLLVFFQQYFSKQKVQWVNLFVFLLITLVICLPWVWLISNKYELFTIGNSSSLNQSWFLGEPVSRTAFFRSPYYANSVGWWEDPFYSQDRFVNMFTSVHYFSKQIKVFFYNIPRLLNVLVHFSALSVSILLGLFYFTFYRKEKSFTSIAIFTIIYPLGYLLTFVEDRYLWIFQLLLLLTGSILLQNLFTQINFRKHWKFALLFFFYISFLLQPINNLKDAAVNEQGKEKFEIAAYLRTHCKGVNFTSNTRSSEGQVIAYLAGKRFFHLNKRDYTFFHLKEEMKKQHITMLLYYYSSAHEKHAAVTEFTGKEDIHVTEIKPGVLVFELIQ